MSPQRDYSRNRGFSPLFRGLYPDQNLRVSDAERQAVVDRLAEHFTDGRLDQAEFDDRVGRAMSAKTRGDLNGLFTDLPEAGASVVPPAVPDGPRRRHRHPVLLMVLLVLVVIAAGHAIWWTFMPLLWIGVLILGIMFATGHIGRSRPFHDR
jgi:Domain of unknown function (DUF1707)